MKTTASLSTLCLSLLLMACESLTAPENTPVPLLQTTIPADAERVERVLQYTAEQATMAFKRATVTYSMPEFTTDLYEVQVYFKDGDWARLPYTLAGDYCGDFIGLNYLYADGQLTFTITPETVQATTQILPPATQLKVVILRPVRP